MVLLQKNIPQDGPLQRGHLKPCWYLEQDDDRKLYIRYVDEDDPSSNFRVPLHEVLEDPSSHATNLVQERIYRMFEEQ